MTTFYGEYEATVDSKGRFLVPGGLRKQMPEGDSRLMINRGLDGCLNLYTMKNWEMVAAEVIAKNDYDPKNRLFKRQFLAGATIVEIDSAGRILIPPTLKEFAALGKDIMLASVGNVIELWDASKYKKFFEPSSIEEFSKLGQEVMTGNKSTD